MSKNAKFFSLLSLLTLIIFACSLPVSQTPKNDPNIVFTAAAQTASVQLTEAALGIFKTKTPLPSVPILVPSLTPPAPVEEGSDCDKAKFVADITVPDGMPFQPNKSFTKTWRIKNIGTCTWTTGYALVFNGGEQMGGVSPKPLVGDVAPGETVDISVNLVAPIADGDYTGYWQIKNASDVLFAKFYVQIKVAGGDFAVISISDMDSFYISGRGVALGAKVTTNKAGKVEYHWILREAGQPDLTTPTEDIKFLAGGTEEVSTLWTACPHTGDFIAYLYIDEPNHQEFGKTNFSCP